MKSSKLIGLIIIIIVGCGLSLKPLPARADVAPPQPPPGFNLEPEKEFTYVQMVAEEVIIEVGGKEEITFEEIHDYDIVTSLVGYTADVTASFWMQNQGEENEDLAVRFPYKTNNGWGDYIPVQNFRVKVNGSPVEWREDTELDIPYSVYWAHFDVSFPVGEEVLIEVSYSTVSFTRTFITQEQFNYILHTGAGWYGPIGHGEIILRLPYTANRTNVILEESSPGAAILGREVRWEFEDLEPDPEDNWYAEIISPEQWQTILEAQQALEKNPSDLEALFSLSQAAYESTVYWKVDSVTSESPYCWDLFLLGEEALARAVSLAPENVELRVAYAEYLNAHAMTWRYGRFEVEPPSAELIQKQLDALAEFDYQWENEWKRESLEEVLPLLSKQEATSTPTAIEPTPTATQPPPPTKVPSPTPILPTPAGESEINEQPDETAPGEGRLPLWGTLLLGVVAFGAGVLYGRGKAIE